MKLFNSMSRKKEEFVPITPGEVKMYCCGPTVYNYIHVGNARPMILFDVLRRYLEYRGYKVTFVQNFTDVDDKIIKRANEEGISSEEVAKKYIAEYFTDAHALGVREATVHPKATENIQQIIDLITTLIDNECYDIYMPNITLCCGISHVRKIAAMAERRGNKLVNIHGWVPGTGVAAALATICSYPNATWLEVPHDPPAITPDSFQGIVKEPLRINKADGCLYCPDKPGFGVELDEDKVKAYTVLEK